MSAILTIAILVTMATSAFVIIRWRNLRLTGDNATSLIAFSAILFTSGLDVGLVMFPLTEFPTYASEEKYGFTNPLAIEFGFWGFLVWGFYFLTTFYFCALEPRLKLFEITAVKIINNGVIIATCAFTGFLFLSYLPSYLENITPIFRYGLVGLVVLLAVGSSTDIRFVKWLSLGSTALFFTLIGVAWTASEMGFGGLTDSIANIGGYFSNIHRFISPISDYHAFYLFWWFAWSIMIGQFVARFVGGLTTWQLMIALLILPSIPIALWFSVLYFYFVQDLAIAHWLNLFMVSVGILFVINSLDSLTRLYSENIGLTVSRLGRWRYILFHWSLLCALILLYQFTPLKIEWIGLIVIGLYGVMYALIYQRRRAALSVLEKEEIR